MSTLARESFDEYQEQPQQMIPPPYQFKGDKADLLDKIKPDLIVEVIMHRLMGEEFIDGKWVKNPLLQDRAISYKGAWDIANIMLSVSSQNVSLSKLKDNEIRARTLEIVKTVQEMCIKNWKEYNINGTDQLSFIHQIVMSNTLITLKQPENEGIRSLLKGTVSESRLYSDQATEKKGILGSIFRR